MTQVAVKGQIWNYEEVGSGGGTPLLILHGWGRSGKEWLGVAKELSSWSGRKAYVLDLPGFGGSSLPTLDSMREYTQLVVEFCKYMEISKVIVIGHSLGGRVGIMLGARHQAFVERLILIDPAGVRPKSIKRTFILVVAKLFAFVPPALRARVVAGWMDSDYLDSFKHRNLYRVVVREDLRHYLLKIKVRTVVLWGENDPIMPLSLAKTYRQMLPDCRLRVVWGAGHDPHLTKYDETLAMLQEEVE